MEPGRIGIVTGEPALARDVERQLPMFGLGASKVVCLPAPGRTHLGSLQMFKDHWGTDAVVLLGAIDSAEEDACTDWIARHMDKPVVGFIDPADPALPQQARLRASGVRMSRDAAGIGELTASLVELPWLPFD
ncbi:hypothetical protein GCM10027034_43290 [Ramlibacter solisilvae]|uniref:Uncharacterized protein n=1 Tax=Ramlibacter tataouinensis TaxID=94132 RepID=A0A127JT61_9BURK|nr:hypothetical protein [Ramlibacter tataouinensis]AMO23201.1 hypothetical protein UC35_10230 [Ramlibacter tataouinensis]